MGEPFSRVISTGTDKATIFLNICDLPYSYMMNMHDYKLVIYNHVITFFNADSAQSSTSMLIGRVQLRLSVKMYDMKKPTRAS